MSADKTRITVWVAFASAMLLSKMASQHRAEQAGFTAALVKQGIDRRAARIRTAAVRAERWPLIESVVADALDLRLAEADVAGPWAPLTEAEAARLTLSGSWPGPHAPGNRLVQRNYALPTPLVTQLRMVSWRLSEEPLRQLEARGLVGLRTLSLSDDQQAERARLAAALYPPGLIVRQALERYGPVPATAALGEN